MTLNYTLRNQFSLHSVGLAGRTQDAKLCIKHNASLFTEPCLWPWLLLLNDLGYNIWLTIRRS